MSKFRTLGLAAVLLAMSASMAHGLETGKAGGRDCRGACDALADLEIPSWSAGALPHTEHELLGEAELFPVSRPAGTPLLHPASFSALAGRSPYLPFDGMAGPHDHLVPGLVETRWNDSRFPPGNGLGQGPHAAEPSVPPRAIPEPNIYALMLAGLAAGAWASRRRKR